MICNAHASTAQATLDGDLEQDIDAGVDLASLGQSVDAAQKGCGDPAQDDATPAVMDLADSVNRAFLAAITQMRDQEARKTAALGNLIARQQEMLGAVLKDVAALRERVEEIGATVTSLQEAESRRESVVSALYQENEELSASTARTLSGFSSRLDGHVDELSVVKVAVAEIGPKLAAASERLELQAEEIRAVCEAETMGEAALDQLVEIWTKLKAAQRSPHDKSTARP